MIESRQHIEEVESDEEERGGEGKILRRGSVARDAHRGSGSWNPESPP
jgi:hypothetical protein